MNAIMQNQIRIWSLRSSNLFQLAGSDRDRQEAGGMDFRRPLIS
jgi:hypothetical protein